jgi:hypothetical protein
MLLLVNAHRRCPTSATATSVYTHPMGENECAGMSLNCLHNVDSPRQVGMMMAFDSTAREFVVTALAPGGERARDTDTPTLRNTLTDRHRQGQRDRLTDRPASTY